MKASGKCPKCESSEIWSNQNINKRGERPLIMVSGSTRLLLDTYICAKCGFIEEYLSDKDLKDQRKRDYLDQNWK